MAEGSVKQLRPRHLEMMHRLIAGQKGKDIAREMGVTQGRLSIIIHSPLFQLEMRKLLLKREEKLFHIQENFLDAAELGTKMHKDILEGSYPTELKLKAATTMTVLVARVLKPGNGIPDGGDGEEKSYEERLREVTFRETVRKVSGKDGEASNDPETPQDVVGLLENIYPEDAALDIAGEEDVVFGAAKDEDDPFTTLTKTEDLVATPTVDGKGKKKRGKYSN